MTRRALITGITGQDGAYLAELLLGKGYEVHGIKRRASSFNTDRIDHLYQDPHEPGRRMHLHYGDLTDATNLIRIMQLVKPDEIYNLAAQSHVAVSFETPEYTANSDALGALRLLEAIRILGLEGRTRFYQASTSEIYGDPEIHPQREDYWGNVNTIGPRACYDEGKRCAETLFFDYRRQYGLRIKVARIFNTYGPRMHPNDGRVVSSFIVQALAGQDLRIHGDGWFTESAGPPVEDGYFRRRRRGKRLQGCGPGREHCRSYQRDNARRRNVGLSGQAK